MLYRTLPSCKRKRMTMMVGANDDDNADDDDDDASMAVPRFGSCRYLEVICK